MDTCVKHALHPGWPSTTDRIAPEYSGDPNLCPWALRCSLYPKERETLLSAKLLDKHFPTRNASFYASWDTTDEI